MDLLFCRINNLHLPIDLQLKLFYQTAMPIFTYGSEIFGFENLDLLEKYIQTLKKITKFRRSTPSYILYAELGRFPTEIIIKSRIIGYWNRKLFGKHTKISYILYQALKTPENITSKWILNVKRILYDIGRHDLWLHQAEIGSYSAKYLLMQTLKDHFFSNGGRIWKTPPNLNTMVTLKIAWNWKSISNVCQNICI